MNRPEKKNAFTTGMMDAMYDELVTARDDPEIKVIIITGEAGSFSAGADIEDMAQGKLVAWKMKRYLWNHLQRIPLLLEDVDKPVIAAIDGPAYGGAFDLALACDLRIASERSTFCSSFVRIGLAPGDGGAFFLPRLVGVSKALEIHLTGRVVAIDEAFRIGLIDRVVSAPNFAEEVHTYAMDIARYPLAALRAIKRAVYNGLKSDLRGHLDYISSQLALLADTDEHRDAMRKLTGKKHAEQSSEFKHFL